jgi:WD40 repeat protein
LVTLTEKHIRVWDSHAVTPVGPAIPKAELVETMDVSPDGEIVGVATEHTVTLWSASTGEEIAPQLHFDDGDQVRKVAFSPDGKLLLITHGKTAELYDTATAHRVGDPFGQDEVILRSGFAAQGKRLFTATDHDVQGWDVATHQPLGKPLHHKDSLANVLIDGPGSALVTMDYENLRVADPVNGKILEVPLSLEFADERPMALHPPDGDLLAVGSGSNILIYDFNKGALACEPLPQEHKITAVAFTADGSRLVSRTEGGDVCVWLPPEPIACWKSFRNTPAAGGNAVRIESATSSPDGTTLAIAGEDHVVRLYDGATLERTGIELPQPAQIEWIAFNTDSSRLVTATDDRSARVWNVATGEPITEPLPHEEKIRHAEFSRDGRFVLTSSNNSVLLWEVASSRVQLTLPHEGAKMAEMSPDGQRILTLSDRTAILWDTVDGTQLRQIASGISLSDAHVSPDGERLIVSERGGGTQLFDAKTCEPVCEAIQHRQYGSFSADGRSLVLFGEGKVEVRDARTGRLTLGPMEHAENVYAAGLSPNGKWIVAAAGVALVVWEASSASRLGDPLPRLSLIDPVRFTPDGKRIITRGGSQMVAWDIPGAVDLSPEVPAAVCELAHAVAGLAFDAKGRLTPVTSHRRAEIIQAGLPGDDAWSRLARWIAVE